jgi:hypothetical protein
MPQFGGKDSKRHFTVVMGGKEHGLYVSSTPSSAARKAVTKLCTANKSKEVEFYMREITQDSKKKTYGPYEGYIEKLKEPIELKGRVIKYKPVAKLSGKTGAKSAVKKGGMRGGTKSLITKGPYPNFTIETVADLRREYPFNPQILVYDREEEVLKFLKNVEDLRGTGTISNNQIITKLGEYKDVDLIDIKNRLPSSSGNKKYQTFKFRKDITYDKVKEFLEDETKKERILKKLEELKIPYKVKIFLNIPYTDDGKLVYEPNLYLVYIPSGNIAREDSEHNPANNKNYDLLNSMRGIYGIKTLTEFNVFVNKLVPKLNEIQKEKLQKDYEFFLGNLLKESSQPILSASKKIFPYHIKHLIK